MEDDARDWYKSKIKGKNWELQNILDSVGVATICLFRVMNNGAIAAITGQSFISDETVWEEDWSIASGRPTDLAENAPNAFKTSFLILIHPFLTSSNKRFILYEWGFFTNIFFRQIQNE